MRCVYPLFQLLQTFTAASLFSCSPRALFTASIRILSNCFGEIGFVFSRARGDQRCTMLSWGAMRQNGEGYVVPMTTRQDGALGALWCDVWDLKEATVFWLNASKTFWSYAFIISSAMQNYSYGLLLIPQHLHSRLGLEFCSLHYFAALMCSVFDIWCRGQKR